MTVLGLGDASASEAGTISSCTFVKVYRVEVVNVFFGALCSYNTSQDVVDSAATSDMHGKELWFAKKILLSLTRLHNKLGLQHHRYHSLAFHTAVQVK